METYVWYIIFGILALIGIIVGLVVGLKKDTPNPKKYTCDTNKGMCVPDSKSSDLLVDCQAKCQTHIPPTSTNVECDTTTGKCAVAKTGTQTLQECMSVECKPQSDTKYICDNGQCKGDKKGTQSLSDCLNNCGGGSGGGPGGGGGGIDVKNYKCPKGEKKHDRACAPCNLEDTPTSYNVAPTEWESYATTTEFGCGDGQWGDDANGYSIGLMNDTSIPSMGAAVPWRFYFNWYGSKANQLKAVKDSIDGIKHCITPSGKIDWDKTQKTCKGTWDVPKACFLAEPLKNSVKGELLNAIGQTPTAYIQKTQFGDDTNQDIKKIIQTDEAGIGKTYLIIPFEGCGGDGSGKDGIKDVANSCFGVTGSETLDVLNGELDKVKDIQQCNGLRALWDNGNWDWNKTVYENLQPYSAPIGIANYTKIGGTHLNWCSGGNMHFDIGMDSPLWEDLQNNKEIFTTNASSNIVMRYKRAVCKPPPDAENKKLRITVSDGGGVCSCDTGNLTWWCSGKSVGTPNDINGQPCVANSGNTCCTPTSSGGGGGGYIQCDPKTQGWDCGLTKSACQKACTNGKISYLGNSSQPHYCCKM
jgi:hypothetical protein